MLSARAINQFYGESHTLWDLSLEVVPAATTCLMGRNGVGKTTFLKCVMGLLAPRDGEIRFADQNLLLGIAAGTGARHAYEDVLELFPVLRRMLRRNGGDLSGGQQQQLAIGRALVLQPKLLILDEPTEGIQPNIVHEIGDLIINLNRARNITVLLVEQKLPFARRVADHYCILDKGRAVATGAMAALNDELVRQYLTV